MLCACIEITVKLMNKGHAREIQHTVFIDKWSLFGGYIVLFNQGRVTKCGLYLCGGVYSEVAFDTGLIVHFGKIRNSFDFIHQFVISFKMIIVS